jgi:hypothetical protein
MQTAAARIVRAIESLRDAEGNLNRVINMAMGTARSSARDAGGDIERAQLELKLALQELLRTGTTAKPTAPEAA